MEYNSYHFNSEQFRTKKTKEKLIKVDFNYFKRLVNRINKYKESICEEEMTDDTIKKADDEKKLIQINNSGQISNFKDNLDGGPSFIEYLKAEFEEGLFNIRGKLKKVISQEVVSDLFHEEYEVPRFNLKLEMKDEDVKYKILLSKIDLTLYEKLEKMPKDSMVSFLQMKIIIENSQIVFCQCEKSEIIFSNNPFIDIEKPMVANNHIRNFYENEKRKLAEKKNFEKTRLIHSGHLRRHVDYLIANEGSQTDKNKLNAYSIEAQTFPEFSSLLIKEVEHSIYGMTNVMRINSSQVKKDIFGMVRSYKVEEKLETIEIVSLVDSNIIKVLHYNKSINLRLKENMIISIRSITMKVNKNFDIYLENPDPNNITIYDILDETEAVRLKKFRYNKNMNFGCIIELTKPILVRTIQKYLVTVKKIFKIMAIHEKDSYVISGFPDLKLIAKCLVDDGSFEAQVYIHDHQVVNLFKLDKDTLTKIYNNSLNSCNVVIYEKFNQFKVLNKEHLENIFVKQIVIYCVPFSNVAKKHFYDNNYNRYFENLGQINNLKNKALNLAFINGDILFDKIHGNFLTLLPRPFLRVMHIESLDN